ncbi:MAG: CRISPR-associated helicase Cas3', partial [Brevibacterium aurantiacum]|nr:CRISPR-associated helicase Cas3' [Brevibacterium aurantiacum]
MWGKSSRTDDGWLPLVQHLQDATAVAEHLWDEWVPRAVKHRIATSIGSTDDDARTLYIWLCGVHDIGKATPPFAVKVPSLADRMADVGLSMGRTVPFSRGSIPHGLAGQEVLRRWLVARGVARRHAVQLAVVVGGHHGVPPLDGEVADARVAFDAGDLGDDSWHVVQVEILDEMARLTSADGMLQRLESPVPATAQILLTGLVIVADWLSSDDSRFPYAEPEPSVVRAERAWEDIGLSAPWSAKAPPRDSEAHLKQRFPVVARNGPHPSQVAALDAAWLMESPGLLVLEAPMGEGKTEVALTVAEVLAHRFGCGGVFVALPTMATSNGMFPRVQQWIGALPSDVGGAVSIALAHSKAHLNDDFSEVRSGFRVYDEENIGASAVIESVVDSWLTGRKKSVLASFVVGTIDQVLISALKVRHVALRHLALGGKVVIIDEVHAADPYMREYLQRALEWLGAYAVPVVLLSATLPAARREELLEAYERGRTPGSQLAERSVQTSLRDAYPLITTTETRRRRQTGASASGQDQHVMFERLDDDLERLATTLEALLVDGGCVAVIRNTVQRAQDTMSFLQKRFEGDVILFHSRFVAPDRVARERELLRELGRDSHARPHRRIVVATQVVEQSLDLDFDLIVSDLAPVDLLLQRIGRMHRHVRAERPVRLREPRCLVTGVDWTDEPPIPVRGSAAVYGEAPLLRAAAVLWDRLGSRPVTLPREIPLLVESGFGATCLPGPESWREAIEEADEMHEKQVRRQIDKAGSFILGRVSPWPTSNLIGWLDVHER